MNSHMEEIVFKPEYPLNLPKYLWLFPFHVLVYLPIMPFSTSAFLGLAGFFVVFELLMIGFYMFVIIKEVRFGDCITISRYLRRDQIAQYSDVQDILIGGFRVDGTYINWNSRYISMKNGDELREVLQGLVEKGIIDESKFPEKMTLTQIITIWATGAFLGTLLTIVSLAFGFAPDMDSGRDLAAFIGFIYLIGFVLSLVAGRYYFKRKEEDL